MVVDASALIAILQKEPERDRFAAILGHADPIFTSVVSIQEAAMVMYSRHGQAGLDQLCQLVDDRALQGYASRLRLGPSSTGRSQAMMKALDLAPCSGPQIRQRPDFG